MRKIHPKRVMVQYIWLTEYQETLFNDMLILLGKKKDV